MDPDTCTCHEIGEVKSDYHEGAEVCCWANEEPRLLRKRETLLPLVGSPSVNALREGLRVSLSQRLEDIGEGLEPGGVTAKGYEDAMRRWCPETPSRRTIGIAVVGREKDTASNLNDEFVALGFTATCR